jgi:DNA-binding NtrC family response regulator
MGKHCTGVSEDVMTMLTAHEWRGNIRELQNVIERAVIFAESETIELVDIGFAGTEPAVAAEGREDLQSAVRAYEKEQICRALMKYNWDKAETAKALGIGVSSLYRKIDELGIVNGRERSRKTGQ